MENQMQVERQIFRQFDRCENVNDTLLRCERRYHDNPWAVVYFDVSGVLPKSPEELSSYLNSTIAKSYYTAGNQLKWNHYLVFVTEKLTDSLGQKQFIEEDRNYARKFVVDEGSLGNFLKGYQEVKGAENLTDDVFGRWASCLDRVGLHGIVDDRPRATLVEEYLSKDVPPHESKRKPSIKANEPEDAVYQNPIRELEIRSFLPHPVRRQFTFARVNLITGPNGVGKTSLLEAIEYFICGSTKRGLLQSISGADIRAKFGDAKDFLRLPTSNEIFRKRDLRWYGRNYDRGNKLAESFNHYNFYNADAAFDLVNNEDEASFKESLSRLALGDAANRLWDRIVKTLALFEGEQKPIQHNSLTHAIRLTKLLQEIEVLRTPSQNIESLFKRVAIHLEKLRWRKALEKSDDVDGKFLGSFEELVEAFDFMARVEWIGSPLTTKRIRQEAATIKMALESLKNIKDRTTLLQKSHTDRELALSAAQSRQRGLLRLLTYLESGIDLVFQQRDHNQRYLNENSYLLSQISAFQAIELSPDILVQPLPVALEQYSKKRILLFQDAELVRGKLASAESAVNRAVALLSELRVLADEVLREDPSRNKCPVCNTDFGSAQDLRSSVVNNDDKLPASTELDDLRLKLNKIRADLELVDNELSIVNHYKNVQSLLGPELVRGDVSLQEIKIGIQGFLEKYRAYEAETKRLEEGIAKLLENGLTPDEYKELWDEYSHLFDLTQTEPREGLLNRARASLDESEAQVTDAEKNILQTRQQIQECQEQWIRETKSSRTDVPDDELIPVLESQLRIAEQFLTKLDSVKTFVTINVDSDLRDFNLLVVVAREAIQKLVQSRDEEKARNTRLSAVLEERKALEPTAKRLSERGGRCDKAIKILREIVRNDSRENAVSDFLKTHKKQIGFIFERIHAPREFIGLSDDGLMLTTVDKKQRALNQISSGQRSALALAIFLTLNGLVDRAPPLILMDDPVINVDDLNTLAFFDNLRELILKEKQQVFFATANTKLASLFEKKFSFLGDEDYQSIVLTRT